jgi:hypothetical protein
VEDSASAGAEVPEGESSPEVSAVGADTVTPEPSTSGHLFPWLETKRGLVGALVALLAANFFLRYVLENAGLLMWSHAELCWPSEARASVAALSWWRYLLPLQDYMGSWTSTSNLLIWGLERWFSSTTLYCGANAFFVAVTFFVGYLATRSGLVAFTVGLCAALTTHNYHVYAVTGTISLYFIMVYFEVAALCMYRLWSAEPGEDRRWWIASGVALLFLLLSYEGWLDFAAYAWLAFPILYLYHRRRGELLRARRALMMLAGLTGMAVLYVVVKVTYGYGQSTGSESDVVFNLPWPRVAFEDLATHTITFFYTAVSTLIPGPLTGSDAVRTVGADAIAAAQGDYLKGEAAKRLLLMNYDFGWRFLAGGLFVLWIGLIVAVGRKLWRRPEPGSLLVLLLLLLVLTGSPTHALVKMRNMHTQPLLGYQVWLAVLGLFALVGTGVGRLERSGVSRRLARGLVVAVWLNVVVCAFTRPPVLNHMARLVHPYWIYPDPWIRLGELWGSVDVSFPSVPWRRWVTSVVVWTKKLLGLM